MRQPNNLRSPRILAICVAAIVFVGISVSTPGHAELANPQVAKQKSAIVHVYLLRGLFNVFSIGMDEIRTKLKRRGINATIHTHLVWESLADEAIADYKSGRVGTIVIMGHSAGAVNAVDMANRIAEAGVPVSLVVALDPPFRTTVASNNVHWVVNLYMPNGMGAKVYKAAGYHGVVENVDLHNMAVNHVTLDKSEQVQNLAIGYTLRAKKNNGLPAPEKSPATATRATIGNLGGVTPAQ
jgi:hypothetical protein